MPARSVAQRQLFAIAEHHPDQLYARNRGLASLKHVTLHEFAATPEKKLPEHVPPKRVGGKKHIVSRSK